ncbi:MAG TPA: class I SAM-dependent methyltransferase [Gammaproteobacteria bacterium]
MTGDSISTPTSSPISLHVSATHLLYQAESIAQRWGFLLAAGVEPDEAEFYLLLTDEHLTLCQRGDDAPGPVYVDFVAGAVAHRRKFGGGKGQPIAKAAGFGKGKPPTIIDATAGLGRDAFVFASLGSEVWLIERSPVVAALLEDGLQRALADAEIAPIVQHMHLLSGDAATLLSGFAESQRPDVIYLDPMFPPRQKSALVKKEIRLFQFLICEDVDADALLPLALQTACERVVVKRPDYAPWLAGRKPTLTFETKKNRFDVYVLKAL